MATNEIIQVVQGEVVEENEIVAGPASVPAMTSAQTDDQLIDLFIRTKNSKATKDTYTKALNQFTTWTGGKPLQTLTLDDLVGYKEYLQEQYSSAHTRKLKLNAVKSLLSFGAQVRYLPFNVGAAVKAEKAESVIEDKTLTEEQIFTILANTPKQRDNLLIRLLYASGGRVSEVAGLTWADVQDSYIIIRQGKGNKTRRVWLSDDTMARLQTHKPIDAMNADSVFTTKYKGELRPMDRFTIYKQIARIGERNELKLHPHMFRHSHGTHAVQNGASIHVVRDTMGHSSIATTNNYLHAKSGESSAHSLKI